MMRVLPTLFLVPVLFLCTGCFFWFHSHLDTSSSRTDIDDQTLKSIIIGSTTIEDVLLRLGEPQDHHDAPTVFLYRWVWERGFIFIVVGPAPGGGGHGGGGHHRIHSSYPFRRDEQGDPAQDQ